MKEKFTEYYSNIKRAGADKLLEWLEGTDFYSAPASTKYHSSVPGGLVAHSINVYTRLRNKYLNEKIRAGGDAELTAAEEETVAICGLLHDVCKVNFYKSEKKSRKTGNTLPNGKPEWEDYYGYVIDDRIPYGHGEKSVYMISGFMKLTREEAMAIRWHMGLTDDIHTAGKAFRMFPLALLTHLADMEATYLDEEE